jgi:hypothetical protein
MAEGTLHVRKNDIVKIMAGKEGESRPGPESRREKHIFIEKVTW